MTVSVPPNREAALQQLLRVFLEENTKLNLSALRTEEKCWNGNILDSLPLLDLMTPQGPIPRPGSIMDVGTGGGFPLLPLAIILPDAICTGLDSTRKKIDAIRHMADILQLPNIDLVAERAEAAGQDPRYRASFDLVTARAVASLPELLEYTVPFAKRGGHVVLWKSLQIDTELETGKRIAGMLGCRFVLSHCYDLPGDWGTRQLLVFEKRSETPSKYPRNVGDPKKEPLGKPS